ncbi:hypothetical protein A5630_23090 [Mycolicibacterium mucogenicum]|uniref:Head-to-tail adaptor n=1 Tax=Mycolicibacterium mucogenicum TaxID=56689 RepID=A0A1A3H106_MYCMU|nr:Gp19/Gp15/Gp42 family protein [Mycolicibacterium mucogenicum]OBJ41328.1 hypothetical protein A5630_23090 [Mycolicibacterium mucogenicum]
MAYAEAIDVLKRWAKSADDVGPGVVSLIEVRLDDAERMIRRTITDLDTQVTNGAIDVEDVKQVEAQMVLRLARNPDGYLSETDGNYTYMLQNDLTSGELEVKPGEWDTLGVSTTGFFTIVPNLVMPT